MVEENSKTATPRYFGSIVVLFLAMALTGTVATILSFVADASLENTTHTSPAIDHWWKVSSGFAGALIGFVGGKVT